jgi:hypothetical protein
MPKELCQPSAAQKTLSVFSNRLFSTFYHFNFICFQTFRIRLFVCSKSLFKEPPPPPPLLPPPGSLRFLLSFHSRNFSALA